MPVPAPVPPDPPSTGVVVTREYRDPSGRAMTGTVTATLTTPPRASVTADVVNGTVTFYLQPGTYKLAAMLRSADAGRVYIGEDITVTQEDS